MNNIVNINWIPSHVGHLGNEVADRLAKLGAYGDDTHRTRPEPYIPVSNAHINSIIKDWGVRSHQKTWTKPKKPRLCRQTRMMIPRVDSNTWKFIQGRTRRDAMYITQVLTGHAGVNKHLYNMKVVRSAACEKCNYTEESIEHYLGYCGAYNKLRLDIFGNNTIHSGEFCTLKLKDIIRFVTKSNRFEYFET